MTAPGAASSATGALVPADLYRIGLAVIAIAVELLRAHYRYKSSKAGFSRAKPQHRLDTALAICLSAPWYGGLALFALAPSMVSFGELPLDDGLRTTGALLGVVSVAGLWWVHCALDANFSYVVRVRTNHQLVMAGPYRWVRHPMYSFFWLLALSYFLMSANYVVGACCCALLLWLSLVRVRAEEQLLVETFGDAYADYIRKTGRLLPRLR